MELGCRSTTESRYPILISCSSAAAAKIVLSGLSPRRRWRVQRFRNLSLLPSRRLKGRCLGAAEASWLFDPSRKNRSHAAMPRISTILWPASSDYDLRVKPHQGNGGTASHSVYASPSNKSRHHLSPAPTTSEHLLHRQRACRSVIQMLLNQKNSQLPRNAQAGNLRAVSHFSNLLTDQAVGQVFG